MGSVCSDVPDLPEEVEAVVCAGDQVQEGAMKEVEVEGHKVLVLRQQGELRAFSGTCTHYGAPLVRGALGDNSIRCPWHGACFSSKTGDIEDFPGLDSLACFRAEEREGKVVVTAGRKELVRGRRELRARGQPCGEEETVLVVGGGAAGHTAVETLRCEGWRGKLVMITEDKHFPYDRPKLSKNLGVKAEDIALRGAEWYSKAEVEVKLATKVVKIDPLEKRVICSSGDSLEYSKLLLATGSTPRKLGVEGEELPGVTCLRNVEQANTIAKEGAGKHLVIIGTSFIGMEVAASMVDTAASVTVIGKDKVPFFSALGEDVGRFLMSLHREKGVQFCLEEEVAEFRGKDRLESVTLKSGRTLVADLVVIGVGVTPNTQHFEDTKGLEVDSRGYIPVNLEMLSSVPDIWAAGDIASFPLKSYSGTRVSIGHWGLAMYLGRVAALGMLGRQHQAHTVPFFWTVQFGKSMRYAGLGHGWNKCNVQTDPPGSLLAWYLKDDAVVAVATLGRDPVAAQFANLVKEGGSLKEADIEGWLKSTQK